MNYKKQIHPLGTVKGVHQFLLTKPELELDVKYKGDISALDLILDFEEAYKKIDLSENQKNIIKLVYNFGLNQKDAGEKMGISQQAVQKNIKNLTLKISEYFTKKENKTNL